MALPFFAKLVTGACQMSDRAPELWRVTMHRMGNGQPYWRAELHGEPLSPYNAMSLIFIMDHIQAMHRLIMATSGASDYRRQYEGRVKHLRRTRVSN